MKNGILILTLLILALFSLSCIYAADVNDTAIASEDDSQIELSMGDEVTKDNLQANNEETVSAETDSEILSSNEGNYSDLRNDIANGGILTKSIYYYRDGDGDTIEITTENMVINGNGAVIDMAQSGHRAFTVSSSGVIIKNLTIKNANYNGHGGAIYFSSSGNVTNCNFTDNYANSSGAIRMDSGSVSNCNFIGNKAAITGGGAIGILSSGSVSNCNFTNNSASGDGGAVFFNKGNVTNCNFIGNKAATGDGGAVRMSSGSVSNCNFTDSHAIYGGAVRMVSGSVSNCNFTDSHANYGGAVYFYNEANVTNCNFTVSHAIYGGAVWMKSGTVSNCNFTGNTVETGDGGAIRMDSGTVIKCNFTGNKATGSNSGGGAIYFDSEGDVKNCNFTDNSASRYGGAVCFKSNGDVKNCNFIGNKVATVDGGAVYLSYGSVSNCNFTDNSAYRFGSAVYLDFGSVENCNFTNNKATGTTSWGGAVCLYSKGNVTNCNFTDNYANHGGAVYLNSGNVENCNFTDNSAFGQGGAVYFSNSGTLTNCNFTDNHANHGGAVRMDQVSVSNCNFTNNSASEQGGAIWQYSGSLENCNFNDNHATNGSAIYFYKYESTDTLTVSNSIFLNNRANAETLEVIKNDNNITITFTGQNNLLNAIYSRSNVEVTFYNVTYWGKNGITTITATKSGSNGEAGQNVTVILVVNDILILNATEVTDENGQIVLDAVAGNCTITAFHIEDSYYTYAETTGTFNSTGNETVLKLKASGHTVTATLNTDLAAGNVTFTLANESGIVRKVQIALTGGVGELDVEGLIGDYNITATYGGNVNYYPSIGTISISDEVPFNASDIIISFGDVANVVVVVPEVINGQNIIITVNETSKNATVKDGKANAGFTDLPIGEYLIAVDYLGDGYHCANSTTVNLTVNKAKTQIVANAITATYNVNKDLVITLKDAHGNVLSGFKVTVVLNGAKTYITDKKGQVKVSTKGLAPKTYTSKITFNGDENYLGSNKDVKVTVKKAKPKIIAKKKTYKKSKKVKKYIITLKSGKTPIKKVKVTIKVGKKTYKAKTNKKGKATFKIKLTKKGKYKAVVKFKGNKYYQKATKKVKIQVK